MDILIADDQSEIRSALRLLLSQDGSLRVVGEAADAASLTDLAESLCPDVVLLDWELAGESRGPDCLQGLREVAHGVRVVALSVRPDVRQIALKAGADEFVCKGNPADYLLAALRRVRDGRSDGE